MFLGEGGDIPAKYRAAPEDPDAVRVRYFRNAAVSGAAEIYDGADAPQMMTLKTAFFDVLGIKVTRGMTADLVRVSGDSMTPLYPGGSFVLFVSDTQIKDGGVYVFRYSGELLIKRIQRIAGSPGRLKVISFNPAYDPFYIEFEDGRDLKILGRKKHEEPVLWNGLRHGMKKKEVKKKIPDINCPDAKLCRMSAPLNFDGYKYHAVLIFDDDGKLSGVMIEGATYGTSEDYKETQNEYYNLRVLLEGKYGSKFSTEADSPDACSRHYTDPLNFGESGCIWLNKGVVISLKLDGANPEAIKASVFYFKDTRKENELL
ncbi:hypothetical protein CHS0354_006811 [Potamilus streckersoni]|uniref:Peptidase S24/S26A/S26B/S26C domain-containing protein n=1 Tax=Potamilus streckersoni TaxID=2493646 RepID=A0AAE0TF51_9BIVA|nr:hypothetical protein CHS0354_006811 [Potamilus streckersoni]